MSTHHPQTKLISDYYPSEDHNSAVKMPVYHSSTYNFGSAEEAARFFEISQGKRAAEAADKGYIYSRLDHPNLRLAEQRMCVYDGGEDALLFESGMAAISASCMALLRPGDIILHSEPLYGGTDHFFRDMLSAWGVKLQGFSIDESAESIINRLENQNNLSKIAIIYVESPANPTNTLIDFSVVVEVRNHIHSCGGAAHILADNTYLGPVFQQPLQLGADLVLYSGTKYIGGHSDLLAGIAVGSRELIRSIRKVRNSLGNMASPHTSWLLTRSLETLHLRMQAAEANARSLLPLLENNPAVTQIHYPGYKRQEELYARQCSGSGATIGIELMGGQAAAFRFLNALKLVRLAVSLGGTESLATHPATTTHSNVPEQVRLAYGIHPGLIRLSIGIEHAVDIQEDIVQAIKKSRQ
ncbi:MAG: aminotransferase class I/II-fold pyridoxal phosphate-dependent enzyme [Bacteroidia bacterium]